MVYQPHKLNGAAYESFLCGYQWRRPMVINVIDFPSFDQIENLAEIESSTLFRKLMHLWKKTGMQLSNLSAPITPLTTKVICGML